MVETSITEFRDTIVTNYYNTTSSISIYSMIVTDVAENSLTEVCGFSASGDVQVMAENTTIYYGQTPATMAVEMQGTVTQFSGNTMCVPADWERLQGMY